MRLVSILVLGVACLTAPTDALRSASSTLARLSQRLTAAEPAYPQPFSRYTFDSNNYADKMDSTRIGHLVPAKASNIGLISDTVRGSGMVVVRTPSKSNAASFLTFPNQLTPSFTLGMWINWNGIPNGEENHVLDSSDGLFQFYMQHLGDINYYVAVVNGVKIRDPVEPTELTWRFYAIVVNHDTQTVKLFRGDQDNGITQIASGDATYPGKATSLVFGNSAPNPAANNGWYGYIDDINIYNYALSAAAVADLRLGTNTGVGATPAPGYSYLGHFAESKVVFANRNAGQSAGTWSITFALSDMDVPAGAEIRVIMHGCGGATGSKTFPDGTTLKYTVDNGMVVIIVGRGIPRSISQKYEILSKEINVVNPTTLPAGESDSAWKIGINIKGLHYEGIKHTPATINLNAALLEMNQQDMN